MEGHAMQRPIKKRRPSTTAKPNSYEDQSFGDFGSQSEASAKIETYVKVLPPKGFIYKPQFNVLTGVPQYKNPENEQYVQSTSDKVKYNNPYGDTDLYENIPIREEYSQPPLTGPMVVKVFPDGTPVKEEIQEMPYDEDLRQYKLSKVKLPSF